VLFSSVVRQMPRYNSQRRGTAHTFHLFKIFLLLCMFHSLHAVYCTTATGCQPNCS
jgi:hypothetical protein